MASTYHVVTSEYDVVDFHNGAAVERMQSAEKGAERVLIQELVIAMDGLHVDGKALICKKKMPTIAEVEAERARASERGGESSRPGRED